MPKISKRINKRKPGQSKFVTQRKYDLAHIMLVYLRENNRQPISLIIYNEDQKSRDYETINLN